VVIELQLLLAHLLRSKLVVVQEISLVILALDLGSLRSLEFLERRMVVTWAVAQSKERDLAGWERRGEERSAARRMPV